MTAIIDQTEGPDMAVPTPPGLEASKISGGAGFLGTFLFANAGMYAIFQGMQQIVLPSQIEALSPEGKVGVYGALASVGALTAAVGNPVFGMLSDRTRSRFGRRAPWLIIVPVLALLSLMLLGSSGSIPMLCAAYILVMLVMSAFQAVITAVLPDHVPEKHRGLASSVASIGMTFGIIYGLNVAPHFVTTPVLAYALIAALLIVGSFVMTFISRDPTIDLPEPEPAEKRGFVGAIGHFLSGLKDHDFAWAFWSRVAIMVGYWTVSTYQLYTLTDYIGADKLPGGNVAKAVATMGTINMALMFVTSMVSGPISDKIGKRKIFVVIASLGVAAGAAVPLFMPTWTGMIVYSCVLGFFFGIYMAVDQAIMTLVLPDEENTARDLGLLNVATTGPQIAAPFLAALIITLTGSYAPLFGFTVVIAALASLAILPIKKVK